MGDYRGKYGGNPNLHRGRGRLNRALAQGFPDVARFRPPWTSDRTGLNRSSDCPECSFQSRHSNSGYLCLSRSYFLLGPDGRDSQARAAWIHFKLPERWSSVANGLAPGQLGR